MARLQKMMEDLHTYLPPRVGEYFVVAGLRFTSFEIVSTIALAVVKFGQELEIDLLGVSSITLPRAFIELNFLVRILPGEGYVLARGELSRRSYLLAPSAHLTGGFAAAFWFTGSHSGDFVVSVGGYHPLYTMPNHYPSNIPRLGINWQVSSTMSIKGGIYFAICPQAMMLGGLMDASYSSGSISAWFKLNIDFIIYWEPFHYDATAMINVGVSATIGWGWISKQIDVNIHAGVHVWGPEFSGKAYLDVGVKTFEVSFGANAPQLPAPISWDKFKEKFLPKEPCTLNIAGGLVKKTKWKVTKDGAEKEQELWIVNAKQLRMQVDSLIPVTQSGNVTPSKFTSTGIAPMDLNAYTATLTVTLTKGDDGTENALVKYAPVLRNVPSALWGHSLNDLALNPKGGGLINDVFGGLEITPAKDPEGGLTHEMDRNMLAFNLDEQDLDYDFLDGLTWQAVKLDFEPTGYRAGSQARQAILQAFQNVTGMCEEDLDIGDYSSEQFDYLIMPQVIALKAVEQ
jgi:hypothetical protein